MATRFEFMADDQREAARKAAAEHYQLPIDSIKDHHMRDEIRMISDRARVGDILIDDLRSRIEAATGINFLE